MFWRHPQLPGLELRASGFRARTFREHFHTTYSIGLIDDGATSSSVWGRPFSASQGHIVILEPYAVHACHPAPDSNFSYRMLFVDRGWFAEATLSDPVFPEPVVIDPPLFAALSDLFSALVSSPDPRSLESPLRQTLAKLADTHSGSGVSRHGLPARLALIDDALDLHGSQPGDVASLAAAAGMSRAHFSRRFKSASGLSPHAYLMLLRVERAKRLLASGVSIAAAAVEVGFADQSHFARTFRRFAGATPAQYGAGQRSD